MDGRGWAVQPSGMDPNAAPTADAGHALDTGLRELSRRLDELMVSVEMLGAHGRWNQPAQPAQPPPPPQYEYSYAPPPPPAPAPVYGGWANPYEHAEPGHHLPTAIEPAAWEQPFEAPTPEWSPAIPAETPAAPMIEVANLDAGPFADLIELRHFEDDLSELARVRDVRVRRFGHRRASIDVAVSSAPQLAALKLPTAALGQEGYLVRAVDLVGPDQQPAAIADHQRPPAALADLISNDRAEIAPDRSGGRRENWPLKAR